MEVLPRALGGLPYDELGVTGFGVAEATDAAAAAISLPIHGATVAIQGFGAVGQAAAERLVELGAVITAVSTATGAIVDADGIDITKLVELRREFGDDCVAQYGGAVPPAAALTTDAQILIPAAREDVIDKHLAGTTAAKLVVEGANMPTTSAALDVLHGRGVTVVPDFVANAGGIVAAAHSMDARYSPFTVNPDDVFPMITAKMRQNTSVPQCCSGARSPPAKGEHHDQHEDGRPSRGRQQHRAAHPVRGSPFGAVRR